MTGPGTPIGWNGSDMAQIGAGAFDISTLPSTVVLTSGANPFVAAQAGVDGSNPADLTTQAFVASYAGGLTWQLPVLSATTAAEPGSHVAGARYILPASPTGPDWGSQPAGTLALDNGTSWSFVTPTIGYVSFVRDTQIILLYNGTVWVDVSTIITHNLLGSLQGGTTAQYYHLNATQYGYINGSQTQHYGFLAPLGSSGVPSFRAIDGSDILTGTVSAAVGGLGINASAGAGYLYWTAGVPAFSATVPWSHLSSVPTSFPPSAHASTHGISGSDPVSLDASQIATGTISLAQGGTGTNASSVGAGFAFIGPTIGSGSGAPTFRAIQPNDISGATAANQVLARNPGNTSNGWFDLSGTFVPLTRSIFTLSSPQSYLTGGGNLMADLYLSWIGVEVEVAGTPVATRPILNFIGGGATAVDNPGNNSVDITITASGSSTIDPIVAALVFGS